MPTSQNEASRYVEGKIKDKNGYLKETNASGWKEEQDFAECNKHNVLGEMNIFSSSRVWQL